LTEKLQLKNKFLNNIKKLCLNSAIEGNQFAFIELPEEEFYSFLKDEFRNASLKYKSIDTKQYYLEKIRREFLDLPESESHEFGTLIGNLPKRLFNNLDDLKTYLAEEDHSYLENVQEYCQQAIKSYSRFEEVVWNLFLAYKVAINEIDFSKFTISTKDKQYIKGFDRELKEIFKDSKNLILKMGLAEYKEDLLIIRISWEDFDEDNLSHYDIDKDYFGDVGLGWIACYHGQLFVNEFQNSVEEKILHKKDNLRIKLHESMGHFFITFENGAEICTLLDENGLEKLLKTLGYKVLKEHHEDEILLLISW